MAALTTGKVLKYTLLPGLWPRLRELFTSGFSHIAYTMALVYQAVRLLPPEHAYLDPANFGRYGIVNVIAEAANNLVFKRRNIDQIIIFFTILLGLILLIIQFVLLIVALTYQQPAMAGSIINNDIIGFSSRYGHGTDGAGQDIAFILLDRIFGLQGIYNSCIADPGVQCTNMSGDLISDPGAVYPFPFHIALHALLRFYSLGIFMVSIIVILYFVIAMVGETAVAGSPFGQRFNKTWAPVRLILFFALLVPLNINGRNEGLNGAQMLTFMSAKLGSNFATNAWGYFNQTLATGETYLGKPVNLVATPNIPAVNPLVRFMFVAKTCKIAEEYAYDYSPNGVQAYLVRGSTAGGMMVGPNFMLLDTVDFDTAVRFSDGGTIEIRFGVHNIDTHSLEKGNVKPVCGNLKLLVTSLKQNGAAVSGAYLMQGVYFDMVKEMWRDPQMVQNGKCVRDRVMQLNHDPNCATWPNYDFAKNAMIKWENYVKTKIPNVISAQINNTDWGVTARSKAAGWGGAAIWYNLIAKVNGEITTAVANIPQPDQFPFVMESIAKQNKSQNADVNLKDLFDPALGGSREAEYPRYRDRMIAAVLYNAYAFWDKSGALTSGENAESRVALVDAINLVFGTQGVFSMRKNKEIHPLAKLSSLGKGMMDAAVRNLAFGFGGGIASGGVASILGDSIGGMVKAVSQFILAMGKATILMSFILFYVLPFLPFIYFFFAMSGWVKSIFEAIVAMPLWALSHITRLDGQGIVGPGANNGYFLILEIFLRPILILVGLLGSLSLFAASVNVLNDVFDLVVANATGFDMEAEKAGIGPSEIAFYRGPIDKFFFSVIYVILCYMMALGYFKMIDQVPNNILRWMGVSVSTFSEQAGDPASTLTSKIYKGGSTTLGQISGGGQLAALFGGK